MSKLSKTYGLIFLVIFALLGLLILGRKQGKDWTKHFDRESTAPFGLFVFDKEASHLLKNSLKKVESSPYEYYSKMQNPSPHNILLIQNTLSKVGMKKILEQVHHGADAFFISSEFPQYLMDTLTVFSRQQYYQEEQILYLTDKKFLSDTLKLSKFPGEISFSDVGSNAEILGAYRSETIEPKVNFLRVKVGKGYFYLHSEPLFITNYYVLQPGTEKYVQDIFSYLPNRETVWFIGQDQEESTSILRFIHANPPLKYAWLVLIFGLLIFVIFNAKRKQRTIPIIKPLKNTSVEFVRSIGNLYLQEGDFHDMMTKKAQYFLHRVRTDFLMDTKNLDSNFVSKLHLKTGVSLDEIQEAVTLLQKGSDPYSQVTKEDLVRMNALLDKILKQ